MWQHATMPRHSKNRTAGLADSTHLKAFEKGETALCTVIIETSKGSRNKYAYDPDERIFAFEILPSSTFFEPGSSLQLDALGRDAARYPAFKHRQSVNRGRHTIHTGETWPSALHVPIL